MQKKSIPPLGEQISGIYPSGEQAESSSEHTCSFKVNKTELSSLLSYRAIAKYIISIPHAQLGPQNTFVYMSEQSRNSVLVFKIRLKCALLDSWSDQLQLNNPPKCHRHLLRTFLESFEYSWLPKHIQDKTKLPNQIVANSLLHCWKRLKCDGHYLSP